MSRQILAFVPLIALLLAACQSAPPPEQVSGTPVTPEQLPDLRAQYMQANPDVRIGLVTAVQTKDGLLAVGYARDTDFPVGSIVSIETPNHQLIANGKVVDSKDETIMVQYQAVPGQHPDPLAGDLAFTFR